ncbi:MAG TPA: DnaJ domain-containing protein [Methylomirabilota bacterium]|nr:DnaJ domain-containing protein [Methylomirabilota bacterium]
MTDKDYYLILGVSRSESTAGIRARFRDLARALHPDVAGTESTSAFQEVSEAYEVLADPVARRRHNAELAAWEGRASRAPAGVPTAPWRRQPVSVVGDPYSIRPSLDALLERFVRNFTGIGIPKSERPEGLTLEVILTPAEAVRGVEVPVGVPRAATCADCDGMGRQWLFACAVCAGTGVTVAEDLVRITIPPLVRPNSIFELPLDGLGIHNLYLRLLVRIE